MLFVSSYPETTRCEPGTAFWSAQLLPYTVVGVAGRHQVNTVWDSLEVSDAISLSPQPGKFPAVNSYAELWGIFLGPVAFIAISYFLFHDVQELASAVGVLVGGWIGQGIGRWLAVGSAAANHDGARLIPLDQIASVQFRKSAGFRAWLIGQTLLVTTADGTVHQFRGRLDGWQAALAGVLTVSGRDVHVTPQGITVTPS